MKSNTDISIRAMRPDEIYLLDNFLYEAIFQSEGKPPFPRDTIYIPEIYVYIKDFGKTGDLCLFAELAGKPVGAVWSRIINNEPKGVALDPQTPTLAISLYKEYRAMGIGTALLQAILLLLSQNEYRQCSLSVQKDNFAVNMYLNAGFKIISENKEDYIMLYKLP